MLINKTRPTSINTDGTVSYTPEQNYTGKDEFSYRVRDINGNWTNVANVYITVNGFFIPNVITPNGDGKNDNFVVIGLDSYDRGDLIIVNRWGNQVYANPNYGNEWNAKGLNSGVYYYILQLFKGANKEVFIGYIQVIK